MFEVDQHQAFLRRLVPAVLSSSAGCSFIFRPPDTGNKSDAWRRSGVAFVHWPLKLALLPVGAVLEDGRSSAERIAGA
jgi:hypothetical protein